MSLLGLALVRTFICFQMVLSTQIGHWGIILPDKTVYLLVIASHSGTVVAFC